MKGKIKFGTGSGKTLVVSAEIGVGTALMVTALLSALAAIVTLNGGIKEDQMGLLSFGIRMVAVFVGGIIGGVAAKEKGLIVVGAIALVYLVILIGVGIAVYETSFQNFVSGVASVAAGGAAACVTRLKSSKNRRHTVRRRR